MSHDRVFQAFLETQHDEGMALSRASDLLDLHPLEPHPSSAYIARFRCTGLVRLAPDEYQEVDRFEIGIRFPADYLRRAEPMQVLTFLGPRGTWHPNISDRAPFICVGRLGPGTSLVDLLYQCFEVLTYFRFNPREDDCLNPTACAWARQNTHRFPLDNRPLKRRRIALDRRPTREDA